MTKNLALLFAAFLLHFDLFSIDPFTSHTHTKNDNPNELIDQAVEAFYKGDYLEVIRVSKLALGQLEQKNQGDWNLYKVGACWDNMGQSYQYLGLIDSAEWSYQQAIEIMKNNSYASGADLYPTFHRYAYLKIELGQYDEAIELLKYSWDEDAIAEISMDDMEIYYEATLEIDTVERNSDYEYDGDCANDLEFILFFNVDDAAKKSIGRWEKLVRSRAPVYIEKMLLLSKSYIGLGDQENAEYYAQLAVLLFQNLKYSIQYEWDREGQILFMSETQYHLYAVVLEYRKAFGISPRTYSLAEFDEYKVSELLEGYEDHISIHYQPFFDMLTDYIAYLLQWDDYTGAAGLLNNYLPKYEHASSLHLSKLYFLDAVRMMKDQNFLDEEVYPNLSSGLGRKRLDVYAEANERFKAAIQESVAYFESNKYALSLDEQKQFWSRTYDMIQTYYALMTEQVLSMEKLNPRFKEPFLNSILEIQSLTKGKSLNTALRLKQAIYASNNSELQSEYKRLLELKEEFSSLLINKESAGKESKLDSLQREIKSVETKLVKTSGSEPEKVISVPELQKKLGEKEAYVEIVKLDYIYTDKKFKYYEEYATPVVYTDESGVDQKDYGHNVYEYVSRPEKKYMVIIVKNGLVVHRVLDSELLDGKAVKYYQNMIQYKMTDTLSYRSFYRNIIAGDQKDYMNSFYVYNNEKHYYIPEEYTLNDFETIYYCPDGVYNLVNPVSLYDPEKKRFLSEDYNFVLISSPSYFFREGGVQLTEKEAVLFGNPDFHPDKPKSLDSQERAILGLFNGEISTLPGTEVEVNSISSILDEKFKVEAYKGGQASEEKLREVHSPALLHIATHGFYIKSEDAGALQQMSNSGLLFTGFMAGDDQYTDGVFSSQEASNLDLKNTELVVLSACQTGLGDIQNGDGVYGLQRGFSIAGAHNIVLSLWTINDEATAQWMKTFYTYYSADQDVVKAYDQTIDDLRKAYSHPYYWGAFVLLKN